MNKRMILVSLVLGVTLVLGAGSSFASTWDTLFSGMTPYAQVSGTMTQTEQPGWFSNAFHSEPYAEVSGTVTRTQEPTWFSAQFQSLTPYAAESVEN